MEWKMKIELEPIVNSKYGSALNLKVELPLLSNSTFEFPKIINEPERFDRVCSELAEKFQKSTGKPRTAKFENQIRSGFVMASCQASKADYDESAALRAMLDLNLTAFVIDDHVDTGIQIQNGVRNYKIFLKFVESMGNEDMDIQKFMSGVIGSVDGTNDESCLGPFVRMFGVYHTCVVELMKHTGFPDQVKHLKQEWIDCAEAHYIMLCGKLSPSENMSHVAYSRFLAQRVHGMRWTLSQVLLYSPGCYMPEDVRRTLLFRMMMDAHGNGISTINAICGLTKDVEEDAWTDTPILRNVVDGGMTLQEAFDDAVRTFKAQVNDFNLALEMLTATYGEVEGVDEYLQIVEWNFMGSCLSYAVPPMTARYVGLTVEAFKSGQQANPLIKSAQLEKHDEFTSHMEKVEFTLER